MKAVYILSSPRGGSTLLSLVLGRHSEIANLGEVSFIPKLLSLNELCTCQTQLNECSQWQEVFADIYKTKGVNLLDNPYGLHLDDVMKHKSGTGKIDKNHQQFWRVARSKIRGGLDDFILKKKSASGKFFSLPSIGLGATNTLALYHSVAKTWDKKVIVDASKLPRKAIHLYKKAPDAVRIIHLTRDSRGVTASRKSSSLQLENSAQRWRYYHSLSKDLIDKWVAPKHVRRLKYEDFVSDPASHLRSLCDWLEIPYSNQALDFSQNIESHSAGGNPTRFQFSDGIRPVDERWRDILTEQDLKVVKGICGDLSLQLGYEDFQ